MVTIKVEFSEYSINEFRAFLEKETWLEAKRKVIAMDWSEIVLLQNYLEDQEMTLMQLNDFIWFYWDDVKEQMENEDNS